MNDFDEKIDTAALPATIRVAATYPASDGSAPESIEVTWEAGAKLPTAEDIARVIAALADVTNAREKMILKGVSYG